MKNEEPRTPDTSAKVDELLRDMRCEVSYTDKVNMSIPLYERIKAALQAPSRDTSTVELVRELVGALSSPRAISLLNEDTGEVCTHVCGLPTEQYNLLTKATEWLRAQEQPHD